MTDSSLPSYTCMGTRMVVITSKEGDSSNHPREGLLVVYQKKTSEDTNTDPPEYPNIRIRLGTDPSIYRCDISPTEVKLSKEEKKRLPEILLQDKTSNSQKGPIQLSFQFTSNSELKIFLKQQLANVNKNVFRNVLQKEENDVSLLRFCADLGESINNGMSHVTQLQKNLTTTRSSLEEWKETANKLEVGSKQEKTFMLKGFYQAWIQNQAKQKKAMDDLKKQLKQQQGNNTNKSTSSTPSILAPDDWSALNKTEETLPESMVAALAEGRKVYKDNERKPILNKDTIYSGLNKDKQDYADERRAKRRGKAKPSAPSSDVDEEMEDVKQESEEEEEEQEERQSSSQQKKKKKVTYKRRRKSSESSLSDNPEKPKASSRKKAAAMDLDSDDDDHDHDDSVQKSPPSKPISKRAKVEINDDDDDSETDDGGGDDDSKDEPSVQTKKKPAPPPKVDSDDDDSDSDDSLLAHMGISTSPDKKKKIKEEEPESDSDTDDGKLIADSSKKPTTNDDSDSDSETDDGQDKKSGFALENSLFKNAKVVKTDAGSDSDF